VASWQTRASTQEKSAPGFGGRPPPVVVVGIASSARAGGHERVKTTLASGRDGGAAGAAHP